MHQPKSNIREAAADLGRRIYVVLSNTHWRLSNKRWEHPRQQQIMRATAALTFLGLTMRSAYADGLADLVSKGADQGDSIKANAGRIFSAVGFAVAGFGGWNWYRKGKEGEHSQVKTNQIVGPLLGGMALGATGFLLIKAGETIGVAASAQGALPN